MRSAVRGVRAGADYRVRRAEAASASWTGSDAVEDVVKACLEAVLGAVGCVGKAGVEDDRGEPGVPALADDPLEVGAVSTHPLLGGDAGAADGLPLGELAGDVAAHEGGDGLVGGGV